MKKEENHTPAGIKEIARLPGISIGTLSPNQLPGISHELRNDLCVASVAISEGGRIASLRSLLSGLEFLTQASENRQPVVPGLATKFQTGPCAGIEECLPTVGFSGSETIGGVAPDHGDFWQVPWTLVNQQGSNRLTLEGFGFSRPFRFRKQLFLSGSTLRVDYTLENLGKDSLPFLYACHPLFAVEPGDRISLPFEVKALDLYFSRNGHLGRRGVTVEWPITSAGEVLDRTGTPDDQTAEMLYTGRLTDYHHCAIHRASTNEALEIAFSLDKLPYLGVWLCYGGWPDSGGPPQYAVALEPTTSPCNTLSEAVVNRTALWIAGGSTVSWQISFTVSGPSVQDR